MTDFLEGDEIFGPLITADIKAKLLSISGATIDRRLQADLQKRSLKGRRLTKPGTLLEQGRSPPARFRACHPPRRKRKSGAF
jgi:hypothetical protein